MWLSKPAAAITIISQDAVANDEANQVGLGILINVLLLDPQVSIYNPLAWKLDAIPVRIPVTEQKYRVTAPNGKLNRFTSSG